MRPVRPGPSLSAVLTSARLLLRPVRWADAEDLERLFHDRRVNRYLPPARRRETGPEFAALAQRAARKGTAVRFAIRAREDHRFLGQVALFSIDHDEGRAEIGYALRRAEWGRGYASEACALVLRWAFGTLRLHRVDADVVNGNPPSVRVLRRLGFRPEGVRREAARDGRRYVDVHEFGLLAGEGRARSPGRPRRSRTPSGREGS